jgi:hypothetical protein
VKWIAGLAVVGVVAAVLVAVATGGGDDAPGVVPTTAPERVAFAGLSLEPPPEWDVVEAEGALVVREGVADLDDALVFGGRIRVEFVDVDAEPLETVTAALEATAAGDSVATLTGVRDGPEETEVGGHAAVTITLELAAREGTLDDAVRRVVVVAVAGGTYTITMDAHPNDLEELAPLFDAVVDGVRVSA